MGLIKDAIKRTIILKIASFVMLVQAEINKDTETVVIEDESTTDTIVDFERPHLLGREGEIVARRFGFGLPDNPGIPVITGNKVQDNR